MRFAAKRPILAAILFGVLTGLAAYMRAIVVPLAALSVLVFRAHGWPWRSSLRSAAIACAVALVMLSPWAVRNRLRYGETFLTDSHGGLTALVGANPNSDGCYSRSLNRMFRDVTGFALLAEPHRQADRASLAIAKTWIKFDPLFTLGLLAGKAERLFVHERALLYWPLFRAGVLPEPERAFFARHQAAIEAVADGFWLAALALALFGCGVAYARKQWLALSLLPQAAILAALYTAIFSEPRYRMPICMLLLPLSAMALAWLYRTGRDLVQGRSPVSWKREAKIAGGLAVFIFAMAPLLAWAGERLREHHRWAVAECTVAGQAQFCKWRTLGRAGDLDGRPGVKGAWNGVGIALPRATFDRTGEIAVETELTAGPGDYTLSAGFDMLPLDSAGSDARGTVSLSCNGQPLSPPITLAEVAARSAAGQTLAWSASCHHGGGLLHVRLQAHVSPPDSVPAARLWLNDFRLGLASPTSGI